MSIVSVKTDSSASNNRFGSSIGGSNYGASGSTEVAKYKLQDVVIRRINKPSIPLNRDILMLMKQVSENVSWKPCLKVC